MRQRWGETTRKGKEQEEGRDWREEEEGGGETSRRRTTTRRRRGETMRRMAMNPPNEDQRQQIEPNASNWTTTTWDEWAQKRQVAPNGDICEGRRARECSYNDSHPAPDETTTTSPLLIDWDTDCDGEGEEGRP